MKNPTARLIFFLSLLVVELVLLGVYLSSHQVPKSWDLFFNSPLFLNTILMVSMFVQSLRAYNEIKGKKEI